MLAHFPWAIFRDMLNRTYSPLEAQEVQNSKLPWFG